MVGGGDALLEQLKPAANRTVPPPEVSSNYSKFGEQLRMVRSSIRPFEMLKLYSSKLEKPCT